MTDTIRRDAVVRDPDTGVVHVHGHAEASSVLRGPGWSSDPRLRTDSPLADLPGGIMLFADGPEHDRLRRPLSPAFGPRAIASLRDRCRTLARAVVESLDPADDADVLADVGYPVTLALISELLDVGVEGADVIADVTPDLVRMLEPDPTPDDLRAAATAAAEIALMLTPLVARRRTDPGDDFVSAMLSVPGFDVSDVVSGCVLLLAAGHETTATFVASATHALVTAPEQRQHLHTRPSPAVEELLRHHGPIKAAGRTALVDHDLGGHRVRAGEPVLVDVRGANHDPARYPDPDRLDLTRDATGHLAFGAGPHFCLGAALARLEAVETLIALFDRFPSMRPTGEPVVWRASSTFHALRALPVHLE